MKDWYIISSRLTKKKITILYSLANAVGITLIPAETDEKFIGVYDNCFSTWPENLGEYLTYNQAVQLLTEEINEINSFTVDVFTREVVK